MGLSSKQCLQTYKYEIYNCTHFKQHFTSSIHDVLSLTAALMEKNEVIKYISLLTGSYHHFYMSDLFF